MIDEAIADVLLFATVFAAVPGFLLFIAGLFVEAMDAMDEMERHHKGKKG